MKKVSVIGSCVCRDLFMNDEGNFEFHTDIRFSSPISMLAEPVKSIAVSFDHLKNKAMDVNGNWFKKTLINDINKTAFDALKENHGEYLIMDLAEARMNIATITFANTNEKLLVTNSGLFRKHYRYNLSKNIFKNSKIEINKVYALDDSYWMQIIKDYSKKLLEIFKEENIILVKTMPAIYYVNQNGCLEHFSTPSHCSEIFECSILLPKLYDYFIQCCPKAKVIEIPNNFVGDSNHKWKTNPFHYTSTCYSYLLDCVKEIAINEKYNQLNKVFSKYQPILENEFKMASEKTIESFYGNISNQINYKEVIDSVEEFQQLGRKKRMRILHATNKKDFYKHWKEYFKQ